jgi:hypothetical protein
MAGSFIFVAFARENELFLHFAFGSYYRCSAHWGVKNHVQDFHAPTIELTANRS